MSHFATPFIVINLGCEMIFVIEQRLRAQNIPRDKAEKVLTDVTTVLLHPKLLEELFTPQPVATQDTIKRLLQDISAVSIMKLDNYSMNKLWDLTTMIYKWQISISTSLSIFDITRRHLKSVARLLPQYFPRNIIGLSLRNFDNLAQRINDDDYKALKSTLLLWFSEYHTKISVLLRLGLQRKDGNFNIPPSVDPKILNNLGENIYNYDYKNNPIEDFENKCADTNEISCLLGVIEPASSGKDILQLKLPIELSNQGIPKVINVNQNTPFENLQTNVKSTNIDLTFNLETTKSPQEDLLTMLDGIGSG